MKTIVHTCSSVLVRPNGIVRYMNTVMDLQRSQGHKVIFVSDAKPTQPIHADEIIYCNDVSKYVPNMKDGHVWLQVEDHLVTDMVSVMPNADLIIAHDLPSYWAASASNKDGVFVIHESDVLMNDGRYTYLDDEWIKAQKSVVNNTDWRIGLTVMSKNVTPKRPVYTPVPIDLVPDPNSKYRNRGLMYIGDSSDRKGAIEFMRMANELKLTPIVISHDKDSEVFKGAEVHSFGLDERDKMYELMSECNVAYIPSKNECFSLAVLEAAQFMPVVLLDEYEWTHYTKDIGTIVTNKENVSHVIAHFIMARGNDQRNLLDLWSKYSKLFWTNLSN